MIWLENVNLLDPDSTQRLSSKIETVFYLTHPSTMNDPQIADIILCRVSLALAMRKSRNRRHTFY